MVDYTIIIKEVLKTGVIFFAFMNLGFAILLLDCDNKGKALDMCIYCFITMISFICTYLYL